MGCAGLSIAEVATDYRVTVAKVLYTRKSLGIAYQNQKSVWRWRIQRQLFPTFCPKYVQTLLANRSGEFSFS